MTKLAKKMPLTLREFINKIDDFVNIEDNLQAMVVLQKYEKNMEIDRHNEMVEKRGWDTTIHMQNDQGRDERFTCRGEGSPPTFKNLNK